MKRSFAVILAALSCAGVVEAQYHSSQPRTPWQNWGYDRYRYGPFRGTQQFRQDLYGRSGLFGQPPRFSQFPKVPLIQQPGTLSSDWLKRLQQQAKRKAPPDVSRWPSWVQLGGIGKEVEQANKLPEYLDPKRCLLARLSDTVEVRPADETAFFPISFWKKTRVIAPGAGVKVEASGRALLVFSDGTRLQPMGATELVFVQGTKKELRVTFRKVTRLEATFGTRQVRLELPEGTLLRGTGLDMTIDREVRNASWAKGGVEGRLWVSNWGKGTIAVQSGEQASFELLPNRRSIFALVRDATNTGESMPGRAAQTPLRWTMPGGGVPLSGSETAQAQKSGANVRIEASDGPARVNWGGVELAVPVGKRIILDPLAGDPFGDGRVTPVERSAGSAGK